MNLAASSFLPAQDFWQQTNGPYGGNILTIAINSSGYLFAGTYTGGVFRSTDDGTSWSAVNNGLTSTCVQSIAVNSSGFVFAGTEGGGAFRSTDNGGSWAAVNNGLTSTSVISLAINSSGYLFAGTSGGVFRSTDNGASWTPVNNGLTYTTIILSIAVNSSGYLFAGTSNGGVFRSTDNGASWSAVNNGLTSTHVLCLAINTSGFLFAGTYGGGVFRTTDNGASWSAVNNGLTNTYVQSLAVNFSGYLFAGTSNGGVFRSADNGAAWTGVNNGLTSTDIWSIAIHSSGTLFAGANGGVSRSTDDGASWTTFDNALSRLIVPSLAINSSGYLFAGTYGGGVFRTTDNGASWSAVNNGLTNTAILSIAVNSTGTLFAGTTGGGVFRSADNGASWTPVNNGLTNTTIGSIAVNSNGTLFAGTHGGVFRSTDNGASWTTFDNALSHSEARPLAINSSGTLFAGTEGGVFRSTDNGASWTAVKNGLTNDNVRSLAIDSSGVVFAGTEGGAFRSTDNGESWAAVNNGLTSANVISLAINSSGYLFAGTSGGGVFRSVQPTVGAQADSVLVTFLANTCTVTDTLRRGSLVQTRGSVDVLGPWSSHTKAIMSNIAGDYWRGSVRLKVGDAIQYKFFTNVTNPLPSSAEHEGWEWQTTDVTANRILFVGGRDTTLPLQFVNGTLDSLPQYSRPYIDQKDSIEVWFRVNMASHGSFNKETQFIGVRGAFTGSDYKDWTKTVVLKRERRFETGMRLVYDGTNFWSGFVRMPRSSFKSDVEYKFVILKSADPAAEILAWEDVIRQAPDVTSNGNRFIMASPGISDTTLYWKWWENKPFVPGAGQINVRLLAPNGGEVWNQDLPHRIVWQANDLSGKQITEISLQYSTDNGANYKDFFYTSGNTGLRIWTTPRDATASALVKVIAKNSVGESAEDVSDAVFTIQNVDTYVHQTGPLAHTLRNDGFTGSAGGSITPSEPSLEIPPGSGKHHLNFGQLVLGFVTDAGDTLANLSYQDEFFPLDPFTVRTLSSLVQTRSRFVVKKAPSIQIEQVTIAPQNETYIIHSYKIFNKSATKITDAVVGFYGDFDLNDATKNLSGYDATNALVFANDAAGGWSGYAGVKMLSATPNAFRRWSNTITEPRTTGDWFRAISKPVVDDISTDAPANYRVMLCSARFTLAAGDSATFAFAVGVGDGLAGIQSVAKRAQQFLDALAPGTLNVQTTGTKNVGAKSAELNGTLATGTTNVQAWFEYGTSSTLSTYLTTPQKQVGSTPSTFVVSDGVTELVEGTTYYFRLAANNGSGIQRGAILSFITRPTVPLLQAPANNAANIPLTPTVNWDPVTSATSYRLEISKSAAFSPLVYIDSTITGTSKQAGSLALQTVYYWRVAAKNASGWGDYSLPFTFTTLGRGTITILSTPGTLATGYNYTVTWSSSNVSGNIMIGLSTNGGASYAINFGPLSNTGSATITVPTSTALSSDCKLRVSSASDGTIFGESGVFAVVSGAIPSTIQLSNTISFPAQPTSSTAYRLVSFPGLSNTLTMGQLISGSQPNDWRAFRDNGPGNYEEILSATTLSVGEGYWLLAKGNFTLSRSITAVQLDPNTNYSIPLHVGWNIIGNPFNKSVSWPEVLSATGIAPTARTGIQEYNGSYVAASSLEPYRGYYFDNSAGASALIIPYPFGAKIESIDTPPPFDWRIQLKYASDINEDPENFVGIAPAAKEGLDDLEARKPPLFMDQGFLYFERGEWDKSSSLFSRDFRPALGDGQDWEFTVRNPRRSIGKITFAGVETIPAEFDVKLINLTNTSPIDLRLNSSYSFRAIEEVTRFKLLVGKKQFVQEKLEQFIPESFELLQNYPNPFNAGTTIMFKVPKDQHVQLQILSTLGQSVKTLVSNRLSPGTYSVFWDGTSEAGNAVASGVYFYRLVSQGTPAQVRKLTVLK